MTIKLKSSKSLSKFTLEHVEELFSQTKNWEEFYQKNKHNFKDIYEWCVFPLLKKEGKLHRCILHPMVEVDTGTKVMTMRYENIHLSEFISHCIYYKPEEHKQYIKEKLSIK